MKKILLGAIVMGVMSTSAMALFVEGTVVGITNASTGGTSLAVKRKSDGVVYNRFVNLTGDNLKRFMATSLTALSTGANVIGSGAGANFDTIQIKNY